MFFLFSSLELFFVFSFWAILSCNYITIWTFVYIPTSNIILAPILGFIYIGAQVYILLSTSVSIFTLDKYIEKNFQEITKLYVEISGTIKTFSQGLFFMLIFW